MTQIWSFLPVLVRDLTLLILLLLPALAITTQLLRGHKPLKLSAALLRAQAGTVLGFAILIGVSLAIGVSLIAQERSLRIGAAKAAEKFELVIGAPGSETNLMFSSVFLQPNAIGLLNGEVFSEVSNHERAKIVAPIALGDSHQGATIVGTTAGFVIHLGGLSEGQMWSNSLQAIAGADAPIDIGARFAPAHGHGTDANENAHEDVLLELTGRLVRTNSPWDRAILVPVESVWETHGLANGHAPERQGQLGPPFDAEFFPGVSAAIVIADGLSGTYQIQSDFSVDKRTMAILPGAVLGGLYRILGDVRGVASLLTWFSLGLVAIAVLAGLAILTRLFTRHLAVLRALGAPIRFITATVWGFSAAVLLLGTIIGVFGALLSVIGLSALISGHTGISLPARFGWTELHLISGFLSLSFAVAWLFSNRMAETARPELLRS
ncbi:MAG: ABC transporter permease [Pseudomonadota bacterium]